MMLDDLEASSKAMLESTEDSTRETQDGFVEILLSFLGNPRALFHKIAIEAFTTFASDLSSAGLASLTDVLDTEETLEGQKRLFAQDDDEDVAEDNDDEEDDEDASDVEMIDPSSEDSSDDGDDGDDGSEGSPTSGGDDTDSESDDEELTQFNNMLALTLQTSKPSANGSTPDSSDSESDMDDDQMLALDPHLSTIFKQRSQITGKKERQTAKQNMIHFKSRVLDLLAVFLDKQHANPLVLEALPSILRLTRASASKQLADKSIKILKSSLAKHKGELPRPDDVDAVWDILKIVLEEAGLGGGANIHADSCSTAGLHIVKTLVGLDKANYDKVVDLYAETQKKWFGDKKSALQASLFTQFMNWSIQYRAAK